MSREKKARLMEPQDALRDGVDKREIHSRARPAGESVPARNTPSTPQSPP